MSQARWPTIRLLGSVNYRRVVFEAATEADHIVAVVEDPQNILDSVSTVKVLERTGDFRLASFPRYDGLRDLLLTLTNKGLKFTEIAGNRKIFLTAIGPAGSCTIRASAKAIDVWQNQDQ